MQEEYIDYTVNRAKVSKAFVNFIDILESFVYAIALVVLVFLFFGRLSVVDGQSMDNTLSHGEYLIVANPLFMYQPDNGDIVVIDGGNAFYPYNDPIVKRIIAKEGQTITIDTKAEQVYVDGILVDESYAKYQYRNNIGNNITNNYHNEMYLRGDLFGGSEFYNISTGIYTATVPEGHVFVMGDNRLESADSRVSSIGFVHTDYIVGKAIFRLFPFSSMGGLY